MKMKLDGLILSESSEKLTMIIFRCPCSQKEAKMVIETNNPPKRVFNGARVKIFGTNLNDPKNERIYLKTKLGWFERNKNESGDLRLATVSQIEAKLLEFVGNGGASTELIPLSAEYRKQFYIELLEQLALGEFEVLFETEWRNQIDCSL
jgi:hypothetical protein